MIWVGVFIAFVCWFGLAIILGMAEEEDDADKHTKGCPLDPECPCRRGK